MTSIGSYAFYDCTNLANVYYSGSQSDWNKITIGDYNECLTNAALHCSSTPTPTPEPTPTPNPAPQPPTQPTQELPQQAAQQTAQQPLTQNNTTAAQTEVAKPKSVSSKTIKAAKKKYYVRVRTYKIVNGKKVYSSWSKVKSVKTK